MAKSYQITIPAHPNIYEYHQRELNLHFCEPEQGVKRDTGLLLLITGFGESASDEYYKHARAYFADTYNLVTVQVEYFGMAYMSASITPKFYFNNDALMRVFKEEEWQQIFDGSSINMDQLMEIGSRYPLHLEGHVPMDESLEYFNDMGIMQALDNITAVLAVAEILKDNGLKFNTKRIIAYGQGHGAYLSYLCNAFAPKLFSLILDHSGWLLPAYLKSPRQLNFRRGKLSYSIRMEYMAGRMDYDEELLFLPTLYSKVFNHANILCFQEVGEEGKGSWSKKSFCESIKYGMFNKFVSANGPSSDSVLRIDSDSVKLFDYVMSNVSLDSDRRDTIQLPSVIYETKKYRYGIQYDSGMPILTRIERNMR